MIDLNSPIVLGYLLIFKNNSLLLIQFPAIIQLYVYQMTVLKLFTLKKMMQSPRLAQHYFICVIDEMYLNYTL